MEKVIRGEWKRATARVRHNIHYFIQPRPQCRGDPNNKHSAKVFFR